MSDTPLSKKLLIKPGQQIAIINAPKGYKTLFGPLPQGAKVSQSLTGKFDLAHLFCKNSKEFEELASKATSVLKPGGILWISYPKQSSKVETDLNRDILWKLADPKGLTSVSIISIDETWSAMRFKVK